MKKIVTVLLICTLCLTGCSMGNHKKPMGKKGSWSIFVYLCGTNLESKGGVASKNIEEMLTVDLPLNVNLIIQTGGTKKWRSNDISADKLGRYKVENGKLTLLEQLPNASMGNGNTLESFLSYGVENYPAEKMGVIFWNHGSGSINGVAFDENFNQDSLTMPEVSLALENVSKNMTDKFEFFGFDACLMATLENAQAIQKYGRYMVGSQEVEPSGGWNYSAFLNELTANTKADFKNIGKTICDSYYEKCKTLQKDSIATLSLIDLTAIETLCKKFETLTTKMTSSLDEKLGLYQNGQAAVKSESYGGSTSVEGYSNLIDLKGFILALQKNDNENSEYIKALDKAVIYNITGGQKKSSFGLSFYYPSNYNKDELAKYLSVCPFNGYSEYLNKAYSNIPKETISFENPGSKGEDGSFIVKLSQQSKKYIKSIDFILLEFKEINEFRNSVYGLGRDNDIFKDWDNLEFHSNFRGIWLDFDGHKLNCSPIEVTEKYIVFSAPIMLNKKQTNLRFSFIWDESYENGGYYKIQGTWEGIDSQNGMSQKEVTELKPGDEITVLYEERDVATYQSSLKEGESFLLDDINITITEEPLSEKHYQYVYCVTDVFGNTFYSNTALFEMTSTVDELKKNPLKDGEYAAKIIAISEDTDNSLAYN